MPLTIEQFGRALVTAGILTPTEIKEWWTAQGAQGRPRDGDHFAELLRQQGKLSDYQCKVLLQGKPNALVFDQYVFVDQLGKGGMGAVFKARHKATGRLAAIKVMNAEANKDEKSVKRFQREVEAAGKLEHPNIVHAIDSGEHNGQHYLVMDFVEGADLASIVRDKGALPVKRAVNCVLQAAKGLQFAHEQGVIHRDIKPANLLLDKQGVVRLLDMGLVRFEGVNDGLTGTQQVMGTVDYMAPEQVTNTKLADARCDIYSLGVTLWILLTGKKLYETKNMVDRVMMHREAPIPSLAEHCPDAPASLDEVLHKMLAKKPDDRFQTMAEVVVALQSVLDSASSTNVSPATAAAAKPKTRAAPASVAKTATAPAEAAATGGGTAVVDTGTDSEVDLAEVPKLTDEARPVANVGEVAIAVKGGKGGVRGGVSKSQRKRERMLLMIYIGLGLFVTAVFGGLLYVFMG